MLNFPIIFLLAFFSSSNAFTLYCNFQYVNWTSPVGRAYSCFNAAVSNFESQELTSVIGTHEQQNLTNSDVTALDIQGQKNLTFFPQKLDNFFPNLVVIRLGSNNIQSLSGNELNQFPNLAVFLIYSNRPLERIPGNFFSQTRNLSYLQLNSNNIKHVGSGLLDGLTNLRSAYFGFNYCVNLSAGNSVQMLSLIEHLRTNCTDIYEETTTTAPPTTTTSQAPSCGDAEEVICHLKTQNEEILAKNQILIEKNEEILAKNAEMEEKVKKLEEKLDLVLEGILELTTRPCGV